MGDPICILCENDTTTENYCHGCKAHICDAHDEAPWGSHEPSDHQERCLDCDEPLDECVCELLEAQP